MNVELVNYKYLPSSFIGDILYAIVDRWRDVQTDSTDGGMHRLTVNIWRDAQTDSRQMEGCTD